MTCKDWNEDWVAHLYSELDPEQERTLAAHLDRCASCRATLDELSSVRRTLREAAPVVPSAPRVVVLGARGRRPPWLLAASLAAAVLLVGAALVAWPRWTEPAPSSGTADLRPAEDADRETIARMEATIRALEERLARLETKPPRETLVSPAVSKQELALALDHLTRRFDRERARDLESVVQALTAAELRTGSRLDQTREAVHLLALRQDPRFTEN